MQRIYIIEHDDQSLFHYFLKKLLKDEGYQVTDTLSYPSLPDQTHDHAPGLYIFFWKENTRRTIEQIRQLKEGRRNLSILLITYKDISYPEFKMLVGLARVAVVDYNVSAGMLLKCIEEIQHRKFILSASIQEKLLFSLYDGDSAKLHLTDREEQVLELGKKGYSIQQTAELLKLSINTVVSYRSKIIDRAGVDLWCNG